MDSDPPTSPFCYVPAVCFFNPGLGILNGTLYINSNIYLALSAVSAWSNSRLCQSHGGTTALLKVQPQKQAHITVFSPYSMKRNGFTFSHVELLDL